MHSDWWGLSRETIRLLYLRHDHFSFCGIFFCLIPPPLPIQQCIVKSSNAISSIAVVDYLYKSYCRLIQILSFFKFNPPEKNNYFEGVVLIIRGNKIPWKLKLIVVLIIRVKQVSNRIKLGVEKLKTILILFFSFFLF